MNTKEQKEKLDIESQKIADNITGPNAFNVLNDMYAERYLARGFVVIDALNDLLNKKLERLTKSTLKRPIRNQ